MGFLRSLFGKRQVDKYGSDGYLLPTYWRCIACRAHKADERASYAVGIDGFRKAIGDERRFQELDPTQRAAMKEYADYLADPVGGAKEPPTVAKHFEDTSGLARGRTGYGFDAVYLCDAHVAELQRAIEAHDEPEGKKMTTMKQIEVSPRGHYDSAPLLLDAAPDLEKLFADPPIIQKPTEQNRQYWASADAEERRFTVVTGYLQHPRSDVRLKTLELIANYRGNIVSDQLLFDVLAADPDEAVRREAARITWLGEREVNCKYAVNKANDEITYGLESHPVGPTRAREALALLVETAPDEDARGALEHLISLPWP